MKRFFAILELIGSSFEQWCQLGVTLFVLAFLGPFFLIVTAFVAYLPILYIQLMFSSSKVSDFLYYFAVFVVVIAMFAFGALRHFYLNRPKADRPYLSNKEAEKISKRNLKNNLGGTPKNNSRRSLMRRD